MIYDCKLHILSCTQLACEFNRIFNQDVSAEIKQEWVKYIPKIIKITREENNPCINAIDDKADEQRAIQVQSKSNIAIAIY